VSIEIGYREPYLVHNAGPGESDRLPLGAIDEAHVCVHGTLWIRVAGQALPMLGYFGEDDACLGNWAVELAGAAATLSRADPSRYVYDEGEQGQPAFVFERAGSTVHVSIGASRISGGRARPDWGRQACELSLFVDAVSSFVESLDAEVRGASPVEGGRWVEHQKRRREMAAESDDD
jgi:hypothetical protein